MSTNDPQPIIPDPRTTPQQTALEKAQALADKFNVPVDWLPTTSSVLHEAAYREAQTMKQTTDYGEDGITPREVFELFDRAAAHITEKPAPLTPTSILKAYLPIIHISFFTSIWMKKMRRSYIRGCSRHSINYISGFR